jgi:hypothetical protein
MQERLSHWRKPYLGSKPTQVASGVQSGVQSGFLTTAGVHSAELKNLNAPFALGPGTFGFFDPTVGTSVIAASAAVTGGKMLYLANSSFHSVDKIGPFHGGYQESSKSKLINPKYITSFEKIVCAAPEVAVCHIGNTNFTNTTTLSPANPGAGYTDGVYQNVPVTGGTGSGMTVDIVISGGEVLSVEESDNGTGYTTGDLLTLGTVEGSAVPTTVATLDLNEYGGCNYEFYCGETYNLQIALGGSAYLSVLNNKVPRYVTAYGGCCDVEAVGPQRIDSTLIMLQWAKDIISNPYFMHFIRPIVYDQNQVPWFATADEAVAAGYAATFIFDNYVSPGYIPGGLAGIRISGAYVETKFGNCSFQYSDGFDVEPVQITSLALVDRTGKACIDQLCTVCEHTGFSGQGFGEEVLREFIDDAPRRTNNWSEDQRLREIEQGDKLLSNINRSGLYTRFIIRHEIPFKENISSAFTSENYELNIYIPCSGSTSPTTALFEAFMAAWLAGAGNSQVSLLTSSHTPFVYAAI